ncbi:MAG: hypothetical protein LKI24_07770 [Acidipropionibacterium sp.]|jgi:cell fate regulator YaaT (PSP1 superfamily)|nr:hypothetical protein [Acidipropionibacterium sp.]
MSQVVPSQVIAVAFQENGRLHYLDVAGLRVKVGDWVLYPTPDGNEVARCVWGPEPVDDAVPAAPRCAGIATEAQVRLAAEHRAEREEISELVRQTAAEQGLEMGLLAVDLIDHEDGTRLVAVYYRSPRRIDFRSFVPKLAGKLHCRVDMRQVFGRNPARITGGVGVCGRDLCCTTFLEEPEAIGMRLAADQGYAANPLGGTGACGKLMCCLRYEHPYYTDFNSRAPAIGRTVETPAGTGRVIGHDAPSQTVQVAVNGRTVGCPLASVCTTAARRRNREDHLRDDEGEL